MVIEDKMLAALGDIDLAKPLRQLQFTVAWTWPVISPHIGGLDALGQRTVETEQAQASAPHGRLDTLIIGDHDLDGTPNRGTSLPLAHLLLGWCDRREELGD